MQIEPQILPQTSVGKQSFSLISLGALARNASYLQQFGCKIAPAVKANAYGVGAVPVVKKLYAQGVREFFVAYFDEAVELRKYVPGEYLIYVLNDVKHQRVQDYQRYRLIPVLYDQGSLEYWRSTGQGHPCAVHFDTGMHRTGLPVAAPIDDLNVVLVMSHLSASEEQDNPMNQQQLSLFNSIEIPKKARRSLANSGGIFLGADYHFDIARPGIACYGFSNFGHEAIQNCVKVYAPILQIDHVKEGFVGYNMTHAVKKPTVIATLGIGYADGVPRELAHVKLGDYKAPVIGKVSMDLITVDITKVPEYLWEEPALVSDEWPGFVYQYALKIGSRVKRIYSE